MPQFAQPLQKSIDGGIPKACMVGVWEQLDNAHSSGKRTVFEGSQAVMLDVDWGS